MIITRYVVKETLKTQFAILFVLLLIFFSQKLIRILSSAVEGDIPNNLIFPLLMLGISEMAQLILPLSLFLAILIAFGRLYLESEMVAMFACGVKKRFLYHVVLFLSIVTGLLTLTNSIWFGPWSAYQQKQLVENAKANPSLAGLLAGQFQHSPKGDAVLYLGNVNRNNLENVFIAQMNNSETQRPSIIISSKGHIAQDKDGNQIILLNDATRYEGTAQLRDFRITEFKDYQAIIQPKAVDIDSSIQDSNVEQLSFSELRSLWSQRAKTEYFWRITLILSVPLMAFMVIPLSAVNPRQGKVANFLPAILLYLVYFLLQSAIKANAIKGRLDPVLWMSVVNGAYFLFAIAINLWNSLFMRKIRFRIKGLA
ncbi:LPS export ABC transporter permease LptF [Zophobihabitans entericus]|uniref:Lipopolysaccharide export system permease protein LptF n=1 Tax=Zophobihabitans entericus TaxID=1635327 RepID=A0A6G9ICR5_9GAMM|nr:LPS export ABC transporter permease LptF [Zophobihabitans entericus]QIQ22026.1 LPS export ABC transporter permease LptF [Zophobihabitans entericus]